MSGERESAGGERGGPSDERGDASDGVRIRFARDADVELIFTLISALAEYERAPEQVTGTPQQLRQWLFGSEPAAEALIAEVDGVPAGFALFHGTFSTWECQPGIWLEDLFVLSEQRHAGVGQALLARLAQIALARGRTRLGWTALDWNEPALSFYRKLGASTLDEWTNHRLGGEALALVAAAG